MVFRALSNCLFAVLNSHCWCWDSAAIFFSMVGLPLFDKESSGTPVQNPIESSVVVFFAICLNLFYELTLKKKLFKE